MAAHLCSRCGATSAGGPDAACPACLLRLAASPESRVPDFEIETLLGAGSGTTYLARGADGGLLAVKSLGEHDLDDAALEALASLDAVLRGFHHANVARTRALDVDVDGTVRLIRDYVRGRACAGWIASATADAKRAAKETLASAIAHAHRHGLAHGNIIGANIVVTGGVPMLLDLGAALAVRILDGRPPDIETLQRQDLAQLNAL